MGSSIILAVDTQSLFSPVKLLFEHSFMLAWARETHSAPDWGSTWVLWSSDSEGKHLPKPHGFLQLFPYTSKFWNGAICPKWESWRHTSSLFGCQSWGESSEAFSDCLSPGSFIFQRKKNDRSISYAWEVVSIPFLLLTRGKLQVRYYLLQEAWDEFTAHRAMLCSLFLSLTVSYPALLCTQLPHSLDSVLLCNWDSILSSIVLLAFRTMSTI